MIKSDLSDLITKIKWCIDNDKECEQIAKNGFNKLLKYHTSEVRAKEFIEICEKHMND